MIFRDREEAGRLLGERLAEIGSVDWPGALVLGIPRGGVIVAAAAARRVGASLDILVPAKIRAPSQPELAIGAVAPDGSVYLDAQAIGMLSIPHELLAAHDDLVKTAYAQNVGLLKLTGVGSRHAVTAAGVIFLILAFIPKLGAALAATPDPVVGGIFLPAAASLSASRGVTVWRCSGTGATERSRCARAGS